MLASDNRLTFKFNNSDSQTNNSIPINDIAEFMSNLQTALYHLGDYLIGSEYRKSGPSSKVVRDKCKLVFENVTIGSFQAQLKLNEDTRLVRGTTKLGEESINTLHDVISIVISGISIPQNLSNRITNRSYLNKIIQDITRFWPNEDSNYQIDFLTSKGSITLKPTHKLIVKGLLTDLPDNDFLTVIGVLSSIQVPPLQNNLIIIGPNGKISCYFPEEKEEIAKKFLGKPVKIYGEARFDINGNIKDIINIDSIKPYTELELKRIVSNDDELELSQSLVVSIFYEDGAWIFKNNELDIVIVNPDYDIGLSEFNDEVLFVWKAYGKVEDQDLTNDAIELKNKFLEYINIEN